MANVLDICRPPSARYLQEQSSPTFHWRARAESHSGEHVNCARVNCDDPDRRVWERTVTWRVSLDREDIAT